MQKNTQQIKIHAKNSEQGLNVYISIGNKEHYITTRRKNSLIWNKLKDGINIDDLKRFKPGRNKAEQKFFRSAQHITKVVETFIKYDLAM